MSMKFYDILLEILTQQEYDPFGKVERDPKVIGMMDNIFDMIKKVVPKYHESRGDDRDSFPSYVSSKDGDRLYVPFETGNEDIRSNVKDIVVNELESLGYSLVSYKKGLAKKEGSSQVVKIGKVLSRYANNDSKYGDYYDENDGVGRVLMVGDILKLYTEDPVRNSSRSDDMMVVFSKHPYDIAGMSTDRNWGSCQKIGAQQSDRLYCGVKEGTIVIYLISGNDPNITRPIGRTLAKQYVNKENPEDIMYVVSGEYGNAPSDFKTYVIGIFDKINKEKVGSYRYNSGLYNDERETIDKYDVNRLILHPEEIKKFDSSLIGDFDIVTILLGNKNSILYLGDHYFSNDMIHMLIRKNRNFFNEVVSGHPVIDWVSPRSRAVYYNILLNKPGYFRMIKNFGYDDITIGCLSNNISVYINRKGEFDVSGVEIDVDSPSYKVKVAAYYNSLLKEPKYLWFGRFGEYGGNVALVSELEDYTRSKNINVVHKFIDSSFQLDIRGVDVRKIESDYERSVYFNQKFNTEKFLLSRRTENPNVFLVKIDDESILTFGGVDIAYYMNINGEPDLTGIDLDYAPVRAVRLTKEMIMKKNLNEIKVGFKRFV
jgi:hypothetical protein